MQILRRAMPADVAISDDGSITLSASSEYAVQRGRYREILVHEKDAVRIAADAVLLNHDPDQLVGTIREAGLTPDKRVGATIRVMPEARTASGVLVSDAIKDGALRGVSIGYAIDEHSRREVDGIIELRATKWTIREISLTPIPADPTVGIGRDTNHPGQEVLDHLTQPARPAQESRMSDDLKPEQPAPAAIPATPDLSAVRADIAKIASQAESLGLRASDYIGMDMAAAKDAMLAAVAQRGAAQPAPVVQVVADELPKRQEEAAEALVAGRSVHEVARRFAIRSGIVGAGEWGKQDVAEYVLGGKRAAEVSSNFNNVTILASQQAMIGGYDSYTPWSDVLVDTITTGDFKTVRVAGLAVGDLAAPGEGVAMSDLTIDDNLTGSGSLTMRGAGLELTKEAIYNDELGLFFRKLAQVGMMGRRHEDISFATALAAANFTSAALGTAALDAASLAAAWAAFVNFTDPAGQKIGVLPKFLVVPPALYTTAVSLTTLNFGGASTAGLAAVAGAGNNPPLIVVVGLHLTDANDRYLAADPIQAGGFTKVKHVDYPVPQIFEVDSGLVASRKFRIEYPLAIITATSAANKPIGWGKATVA